VQGTGNEGRLKRRVEFGNVGDEVFDRKPLVLPDWYTNDGKTDFEDWVERVKIVQRVNQWSEEQLMSFVPLRLKDDAFRVYKDMEDYERDNFEIFCDTFRLRGCPVEVGVFKARLAARRKVDTETYVQLASDIRRLVLKAFTSAGPAVREEMAVDYFLQAITDRDVRLQVRRAACDTLDDALSKALAEESYQKVERPNDTKRLPRVNALAKTGNADGPAPSTSGSSTELGKMQAQIDSLAKRLDEALVALNRIGSGSPMGGTRRCNYCGREGHIESQCFKKKRDMEAREQESHRAPAVSEDRTPRPNGRNF
jgi:hypothetical protein